MYCLVRAWAHTQEGDGLEALYGVIFLIFFNRCLREEIG